MTLEWVSYLFTLRVVPIVCLFFSSFFFYWAFAGFSPSSAWKSQKEKEKPNDIDDARKEIALKLDGDGQNRRRRQPDRRRTIPAGEEWTLMAQSNEWSVAIIDRSGR